MIKNLQEGQEGQEITFTYNEKEYMLKIHHINQYDKYMSVRPAGGNYLGASMNVGKITKNAITLFDYNMMNVRNDYRMKMVNISNVSVIMKHKYDVDTTP